MSHDRLRKLIISAMVIMGLSLAPRALTRESELRPEPQPDIENASDEHMPDITIRYPVYWRASGASTTGPLNL